MDWKLVTSLHAGGTLFPSITLDLLNCPTCVANRISDRKSSFYFISCWVGGWGWIITVGARSITNPSSAALSSNVLTPVDTDTGLEMAKDMEETDPFRAGALTVVLLLVTGAETEGCKVSFFPVKSLVTYSRNSPDWK